MCIPPPKSRYLSRGGSEDALMTSGDVSADCRINKGVSGALIGQTLRVRPPDDYTEDLIFPIVLMR